MLLRGRVTSHERRQEYYARITRESDRLSRLVENLLDFSRMEAGRREYRMEPIDVAPWLRVVALEFQARCLSSWRAARRATISSSIVRSSRRRRSRSRVGSALTRLISFVTPIVSS